MPRFAAWPVAILASLFLLYFAKPLLVPLFLAILLSQLLVPVVSRLERRAPRVLAVLLGLGLVAVVLTGIFAIVTDQIAAFQKHTPELQDRLGSLATEAQDYVTARLGIAPLQQGAILKKGLENVAGAGGQVAVALLSVTMSTLSSAALITIFAFLLLYYRRHFHRHLREISSGFTDGQGAVMIERLSEIGQKYVAGLLSVIGIIGVLDTIGMELVRAPFPVLFGVLGALAVLIPYVGIFVVAPFCAILAWGATDSYQASLAVLAVYAVIHFLEGNVITPFLVGHQVNLNPLTSILAVLIGGELWGPPGMLLFIPLVGMLQLALDLSPKTRPLARLLGSVPDSGASTASPRLAALAAALRRLVGKDKPPAPRVQPPKKRRT